MHKSRAEFFSFFALFAVVGVLLFFVLAPFFSVLALAAVAAVLCRWPYERLSKVLKGQETLAALLIVGVVFLFFVIPVFYLGIEIFNQTQSLSVGAGVGGSSYTHAIQTAIEQPLQRFYPGFSFDIDTYISNVLAFVAGNLGSFISGAFFIFLETFLMLLAFFFFLRDGRSFLTSAIEASPFGKEQTNDILQTMYTTIQSVIKGTLLVALIRWVFVIAAFYLFGIPNALLWGSLGGVVGAIPGVGAVFVFVPAVAYLYLQGSLGAAFGMAMFGLLVIVFVDNLLTPYFYGKGLKIPSIFILFSILGGILFFGPVGFILGPLVLAVFLSLVHTYDSVVLKAET